MSVFQIDLDPNQYEPDYETITADGYRVEASGSITFFMNVKKVESSGIDDAGLEWTDEENDVSFPPGSWKKVRRT